MKRALQIGGSLLLAAVTMYFLYKDFPFPRVTETLCDEVRWHWILAAISMEAIAQTLRGLRWQLMLEPLGDRCRKRNLVGAVYMAFAANLVIPRIGEVSRCATISKTDGASFTRVFGTVVAERIIDSVILLTLIGITLVWKMPLFASLFQTTPSPAAESQGSTLSTLLPILVMIAAVAAALLIKRQLKRSQKLKAHWTKLKEGFLSVRKVRKPMLFTLMSLGIIGFNFFNLWLMFYAFPFTDSLGPETALLIFCMIAFAMAVPTPNGAGPWHYVVMTGLTLYAVSSTDASTFALIVHAIHMLCIITLGLIGMMMVKKAD